MTLEIRLRHWAGLINEKNAGGKTIREFCEYQGISTKTYYYWQRKCREAAYSHIAEIQTDRPQADLVPCGFKEVKVRREKATPALPASTASCGEIKAEIAGILITTDSSYPAPQLAELLRSLAASC
jgi:hypothetical protein